MALNIKDTEKKTPGKEPGLAIPYLKANPVWPKLKARISEYLECFYLYNDLKSYIVGLGKVKMTKDETYDLSRLTREIVRVHQSNHPPDRLRATLDD